jgi:hypothetical protein
MRNNFTANILHLFDVLQTEHGPYPLGRPSFVNWLSAELNKTPGDDGVRRLITEYPVHLASLKGDRNSLNSYQD